MGIAVERINYLFVQEFVFCIEGIFFSKQHRLFVNCLRFTMHVREQDMMLMVGRNACSEPTPFRCSKSVAKEEIALSRIRIVIRVSWGNCYKIYGCLKGESLGSPVGPPGQIDRAAKHTVRRVRQFAAVYICPDFGI